MFNFIKKSITIKLILAISSVTIVTSVIILLYFFKSDQTRTKNEYDRIINNTLIFTKKGLSTSLWNMDIESINNLCQAIIQNELFLAINIYTKNNTFITSVYIEPNTNKVFNTIKKYEPQENSTNIKRQAEFIKFNNTIIGSFELYYDQNIFLNKAQNNLERLIVLISSISILIIFVLFFSVRYFSIIPLLRLIKITQEITEDSDYSREVKFNSADEIGTLSNAFNDLIKQISARDIKRDLIQTEIKNAKDMLNSVINSMPSILISIDENAIVTHWNKAAEDFIGKEFSNAIGTEIWLLTDKLNKYKKHFTSIISNNEIKVFHRETFSNDPKYLDVSFYPIISNSLRGMVIRIDDVTEIEKKEQQLRQSQKMETVGTLAGGLAHDFNNVLGGIMGSISLIEFKMGKNNSIDKELLKKYLDIIKQSSERARDMVQQLLTLSRKSDIEFVPVDINLTVKHVMNICENSFDKRIELDPTYYSVPAIVSADPTQIEQVILNLCINASHAMTIMRENSEDYGGILSVSIKNIFADKALRANYSEAQELDYYLISIKDTGIGIDESIKNKIFEPFFTTKSKGVGSGLGLSMVYSIISQHNGFLTVYSEKNIGTTINLYLPITKITDKTLTSKKVIDVTKGEGLILVVDDEPIMRQMANDILTECGYSVIFAKDGVEAIEVFKENHKKITAILLDMVMPKKSGKEAYIGMKEIDDSLKVLLASGFKKDERTNSILKLGVKGFLQKPYTLSKLSKKIAEIINQ